MADSNVEIKLKDVRLSFDNLFEPQGQKSESGKMDYSYNCVLLLDKTTHADQIKMITDAMVQARQNKWPGQDVKIKPENRCFRDGEPIDPDQPEKGKQPLYDGYENAMYLSAKRKLKADTLAEALGLPNPVQLIGPRKDVDPTTGERRFTQLTKANGGPALLYGGCYVNAIVRIYGYDGSKDGYPNRINCSLEVVQHKRHGDPFGAKKVDANSAMDEEEGEDDTPATRPAATSGDAFDPLG